MFHLVSEFKVKMVEVFCFVLFFLSHSKKHLNPGTGN